MDIQALITLLAEIAGILGGIIAIISFFLLFLREKGYKARITECHTQYRDYLGRPVTTIQKADRSEPFGTQGRVQRFSGTDEYVARLWNAAQKNHVFGVSIYSSKKGTFPVWGSIGRRYEDKEKGTAGPLGFPTSVEQPIHDNRKTMVQYFEGGEITCVFGKDPEVKYY